jgi:hypothetical protein
MCNGHSATYIVAVKAGAIFLKLEIFVYETGKFGPMYAQSLIPVSTKNCSSFSLKLAVMLYSGAKKSFDNIVFEAET